MSRNGKKRLDDLVVQHGLAPSRQRAQGLIMAGEVLVDGQCIDKPGTQVPIAARVHIRHQEQPYVSRGGLKLKQAIDGLGFAPKGKVILDIGASTGGFTDCALQHGASRVYAVDVGYAQLAWSLRQDPRVIVMERTNARYLQPQDMPEPADAATIDVSFISLAVILPPLLPLLVERGEVVALIKPQFEAERSQVGRGGVVQEPRVHEQVIHHVWSAAEQLRLGLRGLTYSPITGPSGNIEFLAYFQLGSQDALPKEAVTKTVAAAHTHFSV